MMKKLLKSPDFVVLIISLLTIVSFPIIYRIRVNQYPNSDLYFGLMIAFSGLLIGFILKQIYSINLNTNEIKESINLKAKENNKLIEVKTNEINQKLEKQYDFLTFGTDEAFFNYLRSRLENAKNIKLWGFVREDNYDDADSEFNNILENFMKKGNKYTEVAIGICKNLREKDYFQKEKLERWKDYNFFLYYLEHLENNTLRLTSLMLIDDSEICFGGGKRTGFQYSTISTRHPDMVIFYKDYFRYFSGLSKPLFIEGRLYDAYLKELYEKSDSLSPVQHFKTRKTFENYLEKRIQKINEVKVINISARDIYTKDSRLPNIIQQYLKSGKIWRKIIAQTNNEEYLMKIEQELEIYKSKNYILHYLKQIQVKDLGMFDIMILDNKEVCIGGVILNNQFSIIVHREQHIVQTYTQYFSYLRDYTTIINPEKNNSWKNIIK